MNKHILTRQFLVRLRLFMLFACAAALVVLAGLTGCSKSRSVTPLPASTPGFTTIPLHGGPDDTSAALRREWFGTGGGAENAALASLRTIPISADEIWVIARSSESGQAHSDESPGSGSLMARIEDQEVPMPLKHTGVRARVDGYIASVDVVQQFHNPYDRKIEAVYVFPLPHNAAVNEFIMTIGERRIRGIIRERREAEEIYAEARRQGFVASLLTEERPNVFTQSVANIEPGKEIAVSIRYYNTLDYVDGWYEFVFPMVVGPRFNPPGSTQGIGAAPRGRPGASGQDTEVAYLGPGERSGHEIDLTVEVNAGVPIEDFQCKTHDVTHRSDDAGQLFVTLKPTDRLPNRDFVLRYRVAGDRIKSGLLASRDERGGYFTLMLFPPEEVGNRARQPLELVFVLDCSGSMSGQPIRQAKAAVARALRLMNPDDSFQIINFSMTASRLGPAPLVASQENIRRGLAYLEGLDSSGGTMMIEGIKAALDFPHDPHRLRFVCFLTDGYIGNETEILAAIHERLGASRIFSFGIGSSVNRFLIDHMARAGRGVVAYVGSRDDASVIMEEFFERISHPSLTDLTIDWGGLQVDEVFPSALPDLFAGRPVVVTGKLAGTALNGAVRVAGMVGGERIEFTVPALASTQNASTDALASVWARMKIADLAARSIVEPDPELPNLVKQVALDYGLMSPFTAFVAVDSSRHTEGTGGTRVPVAVPVPEGVKYETTVPE